MKNVLPFDSRHRRGQTRLVLLLMGLMACAVGRPQAAMTFPTPFNTEPSKSSPMPAAEVAAKSSVPTGFHISVFADEPAVQQPIAMATDPRGRLWVAENYTYSELAVGYHPQLRDRIVVFEDADNNGRFDKRTVFWDGAERLTSIEVGLGGVWAICLPNLVFIPDENSDDVPDGPPQILLDGFEFQNAKHTVANGLRWGPDGWLYGRQGILGASRIGPPGTPDPRRKTLNVGIWRYHPTRRVFEVVAEGTTNPWGMDWDARGEAFFINTVIGHLWHVIPGAHYRRMFGDDPDPHAYELIEQHADHVHWSGGEVWTDVRKGVTDATLASGGGHAHSGLLIYQGGQWPDAWNGKLLTINFHGRRLNVERLERNQSGFVGRHESDSFLFADPWFRGIDLLAAPDGGVFVSDWSDTGECHDNEGIHRISGRIYKLTYGESKSRQPPDLANLADVELAKIQTSSNDWLARQARRVLAYRADRGKTLTEARETLQQLAESDPHEVNRLRALWALHVSGGIKPALLQRKLGGAEHERIWAIRLWEDERHTDPAARETFERLLRTELPRLAAAENSAPVRLALASLLQKLPLPERFPLAAALLTHAGDDGDHNLPLLLWYGIEPLARADSTFAEVIASARIPRVQRLAARRLAEDIDSAPQRVNALITAIARTNSNLSRQAVLDGLVDGFAGRRKVARPDCWPLAEAQLALGADEPLRNRILDLSALFGDGRALEQIRDVALSAAADIPRRRAALLSLIEARAEGLRGICEQLLPVRDLSAAAAKGLALFDDPAVADLLIAEWPKLYGHERLPVLNALVSRPAWAGKLLEGMAAGRVRRTDLGVASARQIRGFNDPALTRRLTEIWGDIRDPDEATRRESLRRWQQRLTPDALKSANLAEGRKLYAASCGSCHRLYGEGGNLGPELTGASRQNLEYLLENVLFPGAVVPAEYRQTTLTLKDGRVLTGIVRGRKTHSVSFEMIGESMTLNKAEIEEEYTSALSLMPEGLFDALSEAQVVDLTGYLMSSAPAGSK